METCAICLSELGADAPSTSSAEPSLREDAQDGDEEAAVGEAFAEGEAGRPQLLALCRGGEVQRLACGHAFHSQCLHLWLARKACCPVCRDGRVSGLAPAGESCEAVPPVSERAALAAERAAITAAEAELMEWALRKRRQATLGAIVFFFAFLGLLAWSFT